MKIDTDEDVFISGLRFCLTFNQERNIYRCIQKSGQM